MNSFARAFLSILVLGLTGTGVYFGAVKAHSIYMDIEQTPLKKQISVKPENIKEKQALVEPGAIDINEFTFFDILNDPSMSKIVGLNESVVELQEVTDDKTSYIGLKAKKHSTTQFANMNAKKTLNSGAPKIETKNHGEFSKSGFVLQVGSFKTLERANLLKNDLGKKGYPVFVVMARISGKNEVYHRVVIGKFLEKEGAVKAAFRVKEIENLDSVIKWQEEGP